MYAFNQNLVVDYSVRDLCTRPYPNHPKGCPNYGKRPICPPRCPKLKDLYDLSKGFWIVWIDFDFAAHRRNMRRKHPEWSQRQIDCCLYWQGKARKMLREEIADVAYYLEGRGDWHVSDCPEALGVNVTATMEKMRVRLEWPPETIVYKVAIIGVRKKSPAEALTYSSNMV